MARITLGPRVRFSYANVFTPAQRSGKYEVDCLIHKSDTETLNKLFAAVQETATLAASDKRFVNIGPQHPSFKWFLKDGDIYKPNDHVYAGHWYFKAKSANRPEVVGPAMEPLSSETQFYSGCFGNLSIDVKLFAPSTNVPDSGYGMNAALGNIQKVSDGERLSGGASASQEFQPLGPPSTGAPQQFGQPQAPQQFGQPQAPQQFGAPTQPAPQQQFGAPAQPQAPQQFGAPAAQQFGALAAPQPFAPQPPANPFAQPAQANPFAQPQQQFGAPAQAPQQFGAPAPGQPVPGINPAAPQAPFPGAQAPAAQPWQQGQFPQ